MCVVMSRLSRYGRLGSSQTVSLSLCVGSVTRRIEVRIQNLTVNAPVVVVENQSNSLNAPFVMPDAPYSFPQNPSEAPYSSFPRDNVEAPYPFPQNPSEAAYPRGGVGPSFPRYNADGEYPQTKPKAQIRVGDASTFTYVGEASATSVVIHNNSVSIPAGVTEKQEFVAFVYNHSQKKVAVSLNQVLPPFSCDIRNAVVSP